MKGSQQGISWFTTEVPSTLTSDLFPWVEGEEQEYECRLKENPRAKDHVLLQFLDLLRSLRTIHFLLQGLFVKCDLYACYASDGGSYMPGFKF